MKKNSKIVLIIVLILAIGFASVSTVLKLGGTTKVGFNEEDFVSNIIFTRSVLDDEDISEETIIEEGKKIKFVTKKLTTVGESTVLDYTVTNKSKQYAARGYVKTFEYDPEYIKIENGPANYDLLPESSEDGEMVITLIKPLTEDKDVEVTIEIEFGPIDKEDVTTTTTTTTTTTSTTTTEVAGEKYDLTIDPDGGIYNGSNEIINRKVLKDTEVTLNEITKEGYIFSHWTKNDEKIEDNKVMISENTVIKAVWLPVSEAVARINDVYYLTIQRAFNAAKTNDEIILLKDTEETSTNKKEVVLNLDSHKITGSITNDGKLRIDNGEIENTNGEAIINNGTLTLGNNEGTISTETPSIIGTDIGIEQKGTLNFYDGYVEGVVGINGDVANTPEEYYVFVDHNDIKNCQKVYLVKEVTRAVVKTTTNGTAYYFNLQDGINSSSLSGYNLYAVRDFEAPYEVTIDESANITFDIVGQNVELGNAVTNNGTLTIQDSGEEKGELKPSVAITNNKTLNVKNISISQSTDAQVIINKKDINITNSTLTGKGGNALELMGEATLNMDDNSYLKSNQWSLYLHDIDTTISKGNIKGIFIADTASLTLEGGNITGDALHASIQVKGNLILNDGNISNPDIHNAAYAIYDDGNSNKRNIIINGGNIVGYGNNGVVCIRTAHFELNSGTIENYSTYTFAKCLQVGAADYEINGGIIKLLNSTGSSAYAVYLSSTGTINNIEIHSTGSGLDINYYARNVVINNLNIECSNTGINIGSYASAIINDGLVKGKTAVYQGSVYPLVVYGGEFYGTEYGIHVSSSYMNIGIENDEIKNEPLIVGKKYGIYANGAYHYFDGIIKGITDAKSKDVDALPSKYIIKETEETIDDEVYVVNTLVKQNNFLEVEGVEYNSLAEAITAAGTEGKIQLINNGNSSAYTEIVETQNLTLDLNGYTLTTSQSLAVKGSLTIDDSSKKKSGKISSTFDRAILNVIGNLIVNDGTIENTNTGNYARVILSENSSSTKKITINGGEFISNSSNSTISITSGNFEMNGGIIRNSSSKYSYALVEYNGLYTINGGKIYRTNYTSSSAGAAILNGTGTIEQLEIHSTTTGLTSNSGQLTINDINIEECQGDGLYIYNYANVTINGGIFRGSNAINKGTPNILTITAGEFYGTMYGINNNAGVTAIGTNDGEIKTIPTIIGDKYGVYNNATINFYDGIIKGITDASNAGYNVMPDGYTVKESEESIEDKQYKVNTLVEKSNYLKVNDMEYNSLIKAISAIETEGTIELIANGTNSVYVEVPAEKNITIDLKGHTMATTQTISNIGSLTIKDSSTEKTGKITTDKAIYLMVPQGNFTLDSGTIENTSSNSYARTLVSNNNSAEKKIIINGGMLKGQSTEGCVSINYGIFEMNGGTIEHLAINWATRISLAVSNANYTINGGRINKIYTVTSYAYEAVRISGTGEVNNLEINTKGAGLVINGTGTINNIDILDSVHGNGIEAGGAITINGGTIKGRNGITYSDSRNTLVINGGTIHGTDYGLSCSGIVNIGENDGNIKMEPVITGDKYGVYNSGTVRYYDGIIKGITDAANKAYTSLATSAMIITDTETIDEKEYTTNTLAIQNDFVTNGEKTYNNLQTAIDEASSGDTLTITDNAFVYYNITIPEDKTITIDLNNHKITSTVTFVNNGNLNIKDLSEKKGGIIEEQKAVNLINNNKSLTINNSKLINKISSYTIYNIASSSAVINNSVIDGLRTITNSGYLEINDSNITSTSKEAIYNNGEAVLNRTTAYSTKDYSLYNNGTATIDSGKYYGYSNTIYQYSSNTILTINNATIGDEFKPSFISNQYGLINIDNSTIYGTVSLSNSSNDKSSIINSNFILSNNVDYKYMFISNASNGLILNNNKMNFIVNNGWSSTPTAIKNTGTITGENNSIVMKNVRTDDIRYMYTPFRGIENTGTIDLSDTTINIDKGAETYAVYNTGESSNLTLKGLDVDITNSKNAYGVYIDNSNITLNDEYDINIDVSGETAYGVYINSGSFTMGRKDESETSGTAGSSVSITNPLIKAIGTTTGIGVRKVNGLFYYYDGKIIGSTNASPDTTSGTEPYYEVTRRTDSTTGYETAILEYMRS